MVNMYSRPALAGKHLALPRPLGHALGMAILLLFVSLTALADAELNASVDRSKIYETDTLSLQVTGNMDMEFSFGGLLNFGRNQLPTPELNGLDKDFDILDQQQNYSMRSINAQSQAEINWTYSLAPKRSGTLTIPEITFKGAKTKAIPITVLKGKAPKDANTPAMVFLEAEVDKSSAYVQEQIVYTLRLYAADHLAAGDLSTPTPLDAIVEPLGEMKKYYRMVNNTRYEVRERQYLLFPQKSGSLRIDEQSFSGTLIDSKKRKRVRVREFSNPLNISVKAPPPAFSGELWLPASSLHISEKWEDSPDEIKVGDSLTRTIEVQALGLLGSALPPLEIGDIGGMKVYPDQPEVESYEHESGVQSVRKETTALVAIHQGVSSLPEIRIPWWDTVNDVERVAVIPARTISIVANPDNIYQQPSLPASTVNEAQDQSTEFEKGVSRPALPAQEKPFSESGTVNNTHPWLLAIALLLSGWIGTTWYLLRKINRTMPAKVDATPNVHTNISALTKAIRAGEPDIPARVLWWANTALAPPSKIRCLAELKQYDAVLYEQLAAFERALYSAPHTNPGLQSHAQGANKSPTYDAEALIRHLKQLEKQVPQKQHNSALRPFYPA